MSILVGLYVLQQNFVVWIMCKLGEAFGQPGMTLLAKLIGKDHRFILLHVIKSNGKEWSVLLLQLVVENTCSL